MKRVSKRPVDHYEGKWEKGKKYTLFAVIENNGTKFRSITPKMKAEPYVIYDFTNETFSANAGWEIVELSEDSRMSAGGNISKQDVETALEPYAKSADLSTVATSGSYSDLSNIPTDLVKTSAQTFTEAQKSQARTNLGAASAEEVEALADQKYEGPYDDGELPSASADTMGAIYLVGPDNNDEYERFVTRLSDGTYSWVSLGMTSVNLANYATKTEFGQLEAKVNGERHAVDITNPNTGLLSGDGSINTAITSYSYTDLKPIGRDIYGVNVISNGYLSSSYPVIVFYAADGTTALGKIVNPNNNTVTPVPDGATQFRAGFGNYYVTYPDRLVISLVDKPLSERITDDYNELDGRLDDAEQDVEDVQKEVTAPSEIYVATTGNDTTGTGEKAHPFATINKAIQSVKKNGTVILVSAGDYKETVDFNLLPVSKVSLRAATPTDYVRVHGAVFHSIEQLSGHSDIYTVSASLVTLSDGQQIAYVDGVPSFPVDGEETLPQMNGTKYRLPFIEMTNRLTKDIDNLADALAFMEGQSEPCLWYDADNQTIYLYCETDITPYKLAIPTSPTCKLITAANANKFNIEIARVNFFYAYSTQLATYPADGFSSLNIGRIELNRCSFMGNMNNGVTSRASYSVLVGCEAGGNGNDGFSGLFYSADYTIDERIDNYIEYRDCWGHDNFDDGFTDHTRGKSVLYGCLSSYNYKGDGYHFVSGSAMSAFDCVAINNGSHGFIFAGGTNDGRNGQCSELFNCVSISSQYGFCLPSTSGVDVTVSCFGCKSVGNTVGYYIQSNNTIKRTMKLYNCTSVNDTTPKEITSTNGNAKFVIVNGEVVS